MLRGGAFVLFALGVLPLLSCAGPSTEIPAVGSGEIAGERQRQLSFQLQTYISQNTRLQGVYHRIAVANAEFCGSRLAPRTGFFTTTVEELPEKYREAGRGLLGLSGQLTTAVSVVEGGPAQRGGLNAGDVLLALDGEKVPAVHSREWIRNFFASRPRQRVRIDVVRNGKTQTVLVSPEIGCAYPLMLAFDDQPNAFTDGQRMVVHSGMLRLVQSEGELAAVVGHELAHIAMGHIEKMKGNQVAGAFGGLVIDVALAAAGVNTQGAFTKGFGNIGALAYATEFEREADYVGAYFVARAGFDATEAERIWRTLSQENPRQIFLAGIHPSSPERFLQMQKTNEEIAYKRRHNLPLRPELKAAQQVVPTAAVDRNLTN